MSVVYGVIDRTLYRMSTIEKIKPTPMENFASGIYNKENTYNKRFETKIKFNTGEFFKQQSNDEIYDDIINYLKSSDVSYIDTVYTEFKIGVDYTLTDTNGEVISEGIVMAPASSKDVYITYPITDDNKLHAKRAKLIDGKVTLSRFIPAKYGIMDGSVNVGYTFMINGIVVLGNLTDKTKDQYIRHLNPSIMDTTFSHNSGTFKGIQKSHIPVFDSRCMMQEDFKPVQFNYKPNEIVIDFSLLMDCFCEVKDDTEIWRLVEGNGGCHSTDPYEFPFNRDPFRPVTDGCHCPHNGTSHGDNNGDYPYLDGMKPFGPHDGCKPGLFPPKPDCDCRPKPPCPPPKPPKPPCPPPDDGCHCHPPVVPPINACPPHGKYNKEWCRTTKEATNIPDSEKFIVVPDEISDEKFDGTTMVKYSKVRPFITDITIGEYVYQGDALYL